MYKSINNRYTFLELKNDKEFICPFVEGYSNYALNVTGIGTLKTYIPLIHKFWIFTIYNPPRTDESLTTYLWNYRTLIATEGFKIIKKDTIDGLSIKYEAYNYKKTNSVKIDMIALKSYFEFIFDELNNKYFSLVEKIPYGIYKHAVNYESLNRRYHHSAGSSYGLKPVGMMLEAFVEDENIFNKLIKSKKHIMRANSKVKAFGNHSFSNQNIEFFPLFIFYNFINTISNPRDRLLYLLCAATGARKSQALNLTIHDVDTINKKVYLTDPLTENKPVDENGVVFMGQPGRKTLLISKYGIYADKGIHKEIRFKYQIPASTESNRELMFLPGKFKELFFETYVKVLETIITTRNPFIFQTRTGKRYLPSEASTIFKNNIKKFIKNNGAPENLNLPTGLHSLRHLNGVTWADIANLLDELFRAKESKDKNTIASVREFVKILVSKKLGITSDAIDIYFNRSNYEQNQLERILEALGGNLMSFYDSLKNYKNPNV